MDNFEWNDELLKDLFRDAVSRGMLSVIYFIDALDECDESGAREIVKFIHSSFIGEICHQAKWKLSGQSHERLKQCCLNYIETDTISPSGGWRKISSMEEAFPFLVYAYTSVLYHADVAAGAGILHEDFITTIRGDKWFQVYDD
ncbi:hypothetical protein BDFG_06962 [Blastomyces dermatitidis ATCC 26199]|nr:hypothetical protein BDFG_06962 [Blastomyces dermatitidis ATCC 26199]